MWIDKAKYINLINRLDTLEFQLKEFKDDTTLYVNKHPVFILGSEPESVSVKRVVYQILNHLNLKLIYDRGNPPTTLLRTITPNVQILKL
jgi:hypothetical protein